LARVVKATAGVPGLPGLPATGRQAPGPAGGAAAHAPAAPGQAGPATALRRHGLHGADVKLAPLLLPSSLLPSPLARLLAFRPAPATVSASPLLPWTLRRLLREAALGVRARVQGLLLWLALRLRLLVFLVLLSCFEGLVAEWQFSQCIFPAAFVPRAWRFFPTDCYGRKA
jgi:hypothetical protein